MTNVCLSVPFSVPSCLLLRLIQCMYSYVCIGRNVNSIYNFNIIHYLDEFSFGGNSHDMSTLFGFLFVLGGVFRPTRELFTHGDVTIAGERLQILICVQQSWPVSNEGSHLLRQGAIVYFGHLRGPVTLTPISER